MRHGRDDYNARIQDRANLIPMDEPVFLLRGQDKLAPRIVRMYADECERAGCDEKHVAEIRAHALEMTNWRPKKVPW